MALRDIFKRQEGGSALGNLVRSVGDKFTGGMVSKFLPPSTAEQVAKQESKWTSKGKTFKTKEVAGVPEVTPEVDTRTADAPPPTSDGWWARQTKTIKAVVIGAGVVVVGVVIWLFTRKKKK